MKVQVRKNNTHKAMSILAKAAMEDGDLRRYIERANGYVSKGQKKRKAKSAAIMRHRKELKDRMEVDHGGH